MLLATRAGWVRIKRQSTFCFVFPTTLGLDAAIRSLSSRLTYLQCSGLSVKRKYQKTAQRIPAELIAINMVLQPKSATREEQMGAPTTEERGMATSPRDRALARSTGGSQSLIERVIAGKWGPSVTPRRKRMAIKLQKP